MKTTEITPTSSTCFQPFDPAAVFADPVGYLANYGIDAAIVDSRADNTAVLPAAA